MIEDQIIWIGTKIACCHDDWGLYDH